MNDFHLTPKQILSLKALHRTLRDRKKADRVKAVVLLGSGWSTAQVAEALLIDEKTVRLWLEKYSRGGENELLTLCYVGKEPLLSETQRQELAKHLDENTYLDSKAVAHHIEKTYGVKYSRTGVKELLHRLDFVYKKPKHVPGKLDPVKQEAFIAEYEILRKTKGKRAASPHKASPSIIRFTLFRSLTPATTGSGLTPSVRQHHMPRRQVVQWGPQAGQYQRCREYRHDGNGDGFYEVGQRGVIASVVQKN